MKSSFGIRTVYIDCYDALGFFEENLQRVMIVMSAFGESSLVKRDWISGRAGGGTWARTLRCVFETEMDPLIVKSMILGLQYRLPTDVPEILRKDVDTGLFRFANIDVYNVHTATDESTSRFGKLLKHTEKKIEMTDLEFIGDPTDFIIACRRHLLETLDSDSLQRLLDIEQRILEKLEVEERLKS